MRFSKPANDGDLRHRFFDTGFSTRCVFRVVLAAPGNLLGGRRRQRSAGRLAGGNLLGDSDLVDRRRFGLGLFLLGGASAWFDHRQPVSAGGVPFFARRGRQDIGGAQLPLRGRPRGRLGGRRLGRRRLGGGFGRGPFATRFSRCQRSGSLARSQGGQNLGRRRLPRGFGRGRFLGGWLGGCRLGRWAALAAGGALDGDFLAGASALASGLGKGSGMTVR